MVSEQNDFSSIFLQNQNPSPQPHWRKRMNTIVNHLTSAIRKKSKLEEMRERYRSERDKRLKAVNFIGKNQYMGNLDKYEIDPYTEKLIPRKPLTDQIEIAIVGGGFAGLLTSARLSEVGLGKNHFRLFEKGGDVGGTWYWNRYPGATCDVEAAVYMPLLEEMNVFPSHKYTGGPEILRHCKNIATNYNIYDSCIFQTSVTRTVWEEDSKLWRIETNRNDCVKAKYVVLCDGVLTKPKLPKIEGIDSFKGHGFHTARWDYNFTKKDLSGLNGLKVAIIGTGASAVQIVPELAKSCGHLYVFQRTPSAIFPQNNVKTKESFKAKLRPGWSKIWRHKYDQFAEQGLANALVADTSNKGIPKKVLNFEQANLRVMEMIRGRVDKVVKNEQVAELLKPYYYMGCKRPCFHDEYLKSFNCPNVTLVDTNGVGIQKVTSNGPVFDGKEYNVDVLIWATGFDVGYTKYISVEGKKGISLVAKNKSGAETLYGINSRDFPNLFMIGGPQSAYPFNYVSLLAQQSEHVAKVLEYCAKNKVRTIEPDPIAEAEWVQQILRHYKPEGKKFLTNCTPGYYNNEGLVNEWPEQNARYGLGPLKYYEVMHKERDSHINELFEFTYEK